MQLIKAFVDNPVKIAVGVLLVALFGLIALLRMPTQLSPEVQIPTISIRTTWAGASPQEVEREIVQEQEEQLKGVEGMTKMTSTSADSNGEIVLEFEVGTDMNQALLKVNSRLQQVREYPEEADEPVISTSNSSDRPIAWFRLRPLVAEPAQIAEFQSKNADVAALLEPARRGRNSEIVTRRLNDLVAERPDLRERIEELLPRDIDVTTMRRFAEDFIEARFERVDGVSESNVLGGREEEMQVVIDPQRLAARQLTIEDVRRALATQNNDVSGGDIWEGKRRYKVRTLGQFRSPEQVAGVIIARRDGAPVYVRDVADVRLGFKKPDGLVRSFGSTGISVNAIRSTGANVYDVMRGLQREQELLNEGILAQRGLRLDQVYDETEYITSAIGLVQSNIVVGGLLTIAVLLVFLRSGRSTIVIALAIPTSLIGTFLILDLLNRSLNVISLAGLSFAVGMLVDNAIVVLENIFRRYQLGEDRTSAAVHGAQEVWGAVVASTLTTLAVFLPVLFVQEEAGQLFRDIALAISAAVGLSMIVSIVVIPVATSRILRADNTSAGGQSRLGRRLTSLLRPLDALGGAFVSAVTRANAWTQRSLARALAISAVFVAVPIGLSWMMLPKVEYLPTGNRNLVIGILLPPPGYNVDKQTEIGDKIIEDLRPYWDVDPDDPAALAKNLPIIEDFFFVARSTQVFIGMRAQDPMRAGELIDVIRSVAPDIPGTIVVANQSSLFAGGLDSGRTIDIEISGPELTRLVELGQGIMRDVTSERLFPTAQARPVPSLDLSSPEVHAVPRWEQAADMGFTTEELGYAVSSFVDGAKASDYYIGGDKIDLTIIGQPRLAQATQDLAKLPLATPSGQLAPLSAVAHVTLSSGPESILHRERQRAITIQVTPPPEVPLQEAMDRIRAEIVDRLTASGALGAEYQINLAGTADKLRETWTALQFNFVLALVITYLLMAALFESWLYPLVIILSVPLGAVGGLAGLWTLNWFMLQPLDVLTMLGFVILIGTVVNNPILIVHQSLNHMREDNMPVDEAIVESVRTRIRPIFMTTMTTVLGLLPLVLFPGAGSELYRGLGSVVLGGLLVSTVFTLVLVPTLFGVSLRLKGLLVQKLFGRQSQELASAAGSDVDDETDANGFAPPARPQRPVSAR